MRLPLIDGDNVDRRQQRVTQKDQPTFRSVILKAVDISKAVCEPMEMRLHIFPHSFRASLRITLFGVNVAHSFQDFKWFF